jgi:hypothetical protein
MRRATVVGMALLLLGQVLLASVAARQAAPAGSAAAASALTALSIEQGVVFRAPENCVDGSDPYDDPAVLAFCAVKDVFGALGGPSSGAAATDFVATPYRFEFDQPEDCDVVGAVADGAHDNCAVVTGAATLLRAGLPTRLFGVCGQALPMDCAVLGTITDPTWKPDRVYMLLDPAKARVHCQYAQDAGRNGCNTNGAFTAGQARPLCSADATDPRCEYGADETEEMLAAYAAYCAAAAETCLENQIEAQWNIASVIAVGYLNRGDQTWDCAGSRARAERFAAAVNSVWATIVPVVQVFVDVARNEVRFADKAAGCEPPKRETSATLDGAHATCRESPRLPAAQPLLEYLATEPQLHAK